MCKKNFKLDIDLQMLLQGGQGLGVHDRFGRRRKLPRLLRCWGRGGDLHERARRQVASESLAKEKAKAEKEQDERMKAEEAGVKAMRDAKVLEVNAENSAVSAAGGR